MYMEDLTTYRYHRCDGLRGVLPVGWLAAEHQFLRALVPPPILKKLSYLAVFKWMNALRGHHTCEFCGLGEVHARYEGAQKSLGWAEIWIPRLDGNQNTFYAAPTLIVHYIANHDYCPPKEFLDAVEALNEKTYVPPRDYVQKHREKLLNVRSRASGS